MTSKHLTDQYGSTATLYQGDCLEIMKNIPDSSIDMILTDIPYGEVNQKSSGLRLLDRGNADTCNIDLKLLCDNFYRICKGSIYIFCGTEQISPIIQYLKQYNMTTRLCVWEKQIQVQ